MKSLIVITIECPSEDALDISPVLEEQLESIEGVKFITSQIWAGYELGEEDEA